MLLAVTTGFYQRRQITALQNSITTINTLQLAAQKANAATEPGSANIDPEEWVQLRADKLALMKMRSEISELRRFTNVSPEQAQQQLKQTRSELASAQKGLEEISAKKKAYLFGKLATSAFTEANHGLYLFLTGDDKKLPQSSDDLLDKIRALPDYNPYRNQLLALINPTNDFGIPNFIEVLPSRSLANNKGSLCLRERQPRQLADGRWARYYGFSDGQLKEIILPDQAFDAWEASNNR